MWWLSIRKPSVTFRSQPLRRLRTNFKCSFISFSNTSTTKHVPWSVHPWFPRYTFISNQRDSGHGSLTVVLVFGKQSHLHLKFVLSSLCTKVVHNSGSNDGQTTG